MRTATRRLIQKMGLNPHDPNFKGTPERVERMFTQFRQTEKVNMTDFPLVKRGGMILLRNHQDYGFCPHHLLPVKYTYTFGYLPKSKRVVGASKPLRIFHNVIKDMPLQEAIGPRVIEGMKALNPYGMGCVIKGEHYCMRMRGVESPCSDMITDCMYGSFLHSRDVREEFLRLCEIKM